MSQAFLFKLYHSINDKHKDICQIKIHIWRVSCSKISFCTKILVEKWPKLVSISGLSHTLLINKQILAFNCIPSCLPIPPPPIHHPPPITTTSPPHPNHPSPTTHHPHWMLHTKISVYILVTRWGLTISQHRPDAKPLFEPVMVRLPTHIYVTRPQWVEPQSVISEDMQWITFVINVLLTCFWVVS